MKSELDSFINGLLPAAISFGVFAILSSFAIHSCDGQDLRAEFFESRIRPVLIEHCYSCHNSVDQAEADFALDWRTGIRTKTDHGTGVVPGKPNESLLLKVIEHQIDGFEMPEDGAKLDPEVIADIRKWIADGATDPRDEPPTENELKESISWEATLESRKKWWSFQPIHNPELPAANEWSDHPIDRFIYRAAKSKQLQPNPAAENRVLARRLSFALTGLPPTRERLAEIDSGNKSIEALVDELLSSPHFGERWARHWMDLVRYADSHGSEGDPAIPNAYRYRDYLIRAFNSDVPYKQLVREHIAGDLLAEPRINDQLGINESAIGPAHWRLCFHGFAPTDALDEKVRFTDDQINVFGKTFLGLTISCARCHDHKFDAISQSDYYALFGVIGSCRPAMKDVNTPKRQLQHQAELKQIKTEIKNRLAEAWLKQTDRLADRLIDEDDEIQELVQAADSPEHSLHTWKRLVSDSKQHQNFESAWKKQQQTWSQQLANQTKLGNEKLTWDLATNRDFDDWFGEGSESMKPVGAGEFTISTENEQVVSAIYPSGVYTNLLSNRHRGVLGSPRFLAGSKLTAWIQCVGGGQATARFVVQNYPRSGTVYPINEVKNRNWHWQRFNLDYWEGDQVHLEIATAKDAPLQTRNSDRSWFGVRNVVVRKSELGPPSKFPLEFLTPLFETTAERKPQSTAELANRFASAATDAVKAWRDEKLSDQQALFLDALVRDAVLPNSFESLPEVRGAVQRYRKTELDVPLPFRVPGLAEADSFDQPLFERGNHRKPLDPVRRRFLEAIDPSPYATKTSGRLELANDLFRDDNPLTSRVIVNRIWLSLFGRGLVATPDNFGRLGAKPTHPELLDFLATQMVEQGWSIKKMIRLIVLSKTWQQSSIASPDAQKVDPENKWISHFGLERLDAESIRDSMVSATGQLSTELYGPSFAPDANSNRRAVYVRSKRNDMDKFLATFDSPIPFATTGKRNSTNVPAQSLALMNSPFVIKLANDWAEQARKEMPEATNSQRIRVMYETAIGREPREDELISLARYAHYSGNMLSQRAVKRDRLGRLAVDLKNQLKSILDPARQNIIDSQAQSPDKPAVLTPFARWDFSKGPTDTITGLQLTLHSHARIENDALVLDGRGFALSDPISKPIKARTLEAWVQLKGLKQKGGGVVTIQDLPGHIFDSIVFAELKNKHWLSGSNNHHRTLPFDGEAEKSAKNFPVHLAISFAEDGTITGYRNGIPYGKPIRKSDIQDYAKDQTRIALGIRHGNKTTPGRMLVGKILEVRVYDQALSAEQVASSFSGQPFTSDADVLAKLDPGQRIQVDHLRKQVTAIEEEVQRVTNSSPGPHDPLAQVAHAIFNLKEFIYVR